MKPMIAITTRRLEHDKNQRCFVNEEYVSSIEKGGGIPVLIISRKKDEIIRLLQHCDGLLVTGGVDLNPELYGQENRASGGVDDIQDEHDYHCIEAAQELGLPIMGICRGLQVLNVFNHGTLFQDIHKSHPEIATDKHASDTDRPATHTVHIQKDSFLEALFADSTVVNSYHHQSIDTLGEGLEVAAISDDGIIEAIQGNNTFAVQWHPERMSEQVSLFAWFIMQCAKV